MFHLLFHRNELGLNTCMEPGSEAIFVAAFVAAIVLAWLYLGYLFLFSSKKKLGGPFFWMSCSMILYFPAFYFLFRCATHSFGLGASHEDRSTDFGVAGLIWALSLYCTLRAIKALVIRRNETSRSEQPPIQNKDPEPKP